MSGDRKEILRIAIPAVLEALFTTMASIIDSKMVSSLGLTAISAVSVTNQPRLFALCVFFAINVVVTSFTARKIGMRDRDDANRVLISALCVALLLVLILSMLCVVLAEPIMQICGNQPDTLADSVVYFRIVMGGLVFNVLFMVINASFRGCGNTRLTLVSNVVSCLVNITLNYMLIEGNWGAPRMEIAGAAIATVAGTAAAFLICVLFACNGKNYVNFLYSIKQRIFPTFSLLKEMFGMWKKIVTENLFTRVGFLLTSMLAANTGSFSMSVYSVGMHLMNINFALGSGLQSAAVALVGRSYGSGDKERIRSLSESILRMGAISALVLSAVFVVFGRPYYGFFSGDPEFIRTGVISCVIIGIVSPIQTLQIIYNGIFQGTGDVQYTMKAAIISVTVVNTIVSFVGTVLIPGGIWGIWAGVFLSQLVRMLMLKNRYRKRILEGSAVA
ncbi:MAG: MATE family efflux transporter [Christensenellales bacterium]|nr:MATE family efflux transporter [Christensenellales bacterium]